MLFKSQPVALAVQLLIWTKMPHRSRVFKTRILQNKNRVSETRFSKKKPFYTHRYRVLETRYFFKICIELESYKLEFYWEKFYKAHAVHKIS